MKTLLLAFAGLFLAASAHAGILNLVNGKDTCDGHAVPVSATVTLADRQENLTTIGSGLRTYTILKVKIYCFQMMASDPANYQKTESGALSSLSAMQTVALRMDFVYHVTSAQLKKAFLDGFNANGVDLTNPSIQAFMNAAVAGGDVQDGQAITIALDLKTGSILYEDNNGKVTTIPNVQSSNASILSIWLGKTADSGLAALKKQLLGE